MKNQSTRVTDILGGKLTSSANAPPRGLAGYDDFRKKLRPLRRLPPTRRPRLRIEAIGSRGYRLSDVASSGVVIRNLRLEESGRRGAEAGRLGGVGQDRAKTLSLGSVR